MSYPADLDDILGRTMAVRCKVEPRNRQASVVRYSERKDFIENIIDEIATAEVRELRTMTLFRQSSLCLLHLINISVFFNRILHKM